MIPPTGLIGGASYPGLVHDNTTNGIAGRPELDRKVDAETHRLPDGDTAVHLVPPGYEGTTSTPWREVDGGMCDCCPAVGIRRDGDHVTRVLTHFRLGEVAA